MKCKNCEEEIAKFDGKYWHKQVKVLRIGHTKQTIISLGKNLYFGVERCLKAEPKEDKK